jgi:hypothetical protein
VVDFALDVLSETLRYFTVIVILTLQVEMSRCIVPERMLILGGRIGRYVW